MKIRSTFAILDVKDGREALAKHFEVNGAKPLRIQIEADIVSIWGNDDGVSREFQLEVKSAEIQK